MNGITNASAIVATFLDRVHAFSGVVTLTLAHFIWQGVVVVLLFALANWRLRNWSANARYIGSVVALFALLACPMITFSLLSATSASEHLNQTMMPTRPRGASSRFVPIPVSTVPAGSAEVVPSESPVTIPSTVRVKKWVESFSPIVSIAYLFGVIAMLTRLRRGVAKGRKCRNVATILDDPTIHQLIAERCHRWSMRFVPSIACCQRVSVPVVVGVMRPMILIPPAILSGFTTAQIESMLVHELAHIRRWDPLVHLIQRIAESMLFFHPAVWYVSRQMTIEREIACDDFVTAAGWAPQDYAATLLALADHYVHGNAEWKATMLAASGDRPSQFKLRILRLLGEDRPNQMIDVNRREMVSTLLLFVVASAALFGQTSAQARMTQLGEVDRGKQVEVGDSARATDEATEATDSTGPEETNESREPGAGEFCVSAVVIEGVSTIAVAEVEKHIKTRVGRRFSQKQLKDDVDALVRTRWFASVEPIIRPSPAGDVLVFKLLERPIVRRVEYKGLKKVKQKVFDSLTQLKPGRPFDVASNRECARRIEEYYHAKGYAFATVELERGNDRDDREVVFLINEGPKVKVSSVHFQGSDESSSGLSTAMARKRILNIWLFGDQYDYSTIADEIADVKGYYHMLGFFDVEVKEHLKFSDDKSRVEIHYEVTEGIRYKVRNIEIVGNSIFSKDELREMMSVKAGADYNGQEINRDVDVIKSTYAEQGRLFCRVEVVPCIDEGKSIVDLLYGIAENKVYGIGSIDLRIGVENPQTPSDSAPTQSGNSRDVLGPVPIKIDFSKPLDVTNLKSRKLDEKSD